MTIGSRMKSLRTEAGVLQSNLAKELGCSAQVISNIERGYTQPAAELVDKYAAFFGVPADFILGRTTARYAPNVDPELCSVFAARTKGRMLQLQMDAPGLAGLIGLTEESCLEILSGKLLPNLNTAARLSKALCTTMDYLTGNSEFVHAIASEDERDIIETFRSLNKRERRMFLGMMEKVKGK